MKFKVVAALLLTATVVAPIGLAWLLLGALSQARHCFTAILVMMVAAGLTAW